MATNTIIPSDPGDLLPWLKQLRQELYEREQSLVARQRGLKHDLADGRGLRLVREGDDA